MKTGRTEVAPSLRPTAANLRETKMGIEFLVPTLFGVKAAAVLGFAIHQIASVRSSQHNS